MAFVSNTTLIKAVINKDYHNVIKAVKDCSVNDVNAVDSQGCTALHYACMFAGLQVGRDIVKVLLNAGADAAIIDNDGNQALFYASDSISDDVVSLLLPLSNPYQQNISGCFPFGHACCFGTLNVVKAFMKYDSNLLHYKNRYGYTALKDACLEDRLNIVAYLLSCGANRNAGYFDDYWYENNQHLSTECRELLKR